MCSRLRQDLGTISPETRFLRRSLVTTPWIFPRNRVSLPRPRAPHKYLYLAILAMC
ncbi:hypothetical protein ACE1CM_16865 [Microseira sp. BLCC-F43]